MHNEPKKMYQDCHVENESALDFNIVDVFGQRKMTRIPEFKISPLSVTGCSCLFPFWLFGQCYDQHRSILGPAIE